MRDRHEIVKDDRHLGIDQFFGGIVGGEDAPFKVGQLVTPKTSLLRNVWIVRTCERYTCANGELQWTCFLEDYSRIHPGCTVARAETLEPWVAGVSGAKFRIGQLVTVLVDSAATKAVGMIGENVEWVNVGAKGSIISHELVHGACYYSVLMFDFNAKQHKKTIMINERDLKASD